MFSLSNEIVPRPKRARAGHHMMRYDGDEITFPFHFTREFRGSLQSVNRQTEETDRPPPVVICRRLLINHTHFLSDGNRLLKPVSQHVCAAAVIVVVVISDVNHVFCFGFV